MRRSPVRVVFVLAAAAVFGLSLFALPPLHAVIGSSPQTCDSYSYSYAYSYSIYRPYISRRRPGGYSYGYGYAANCVCPGGYTAYAYDLPRTADAYGYVYCPAQAPPTTTIPPTTTTSIAPTTTTVARTTTTIAPTTTTVATTTTTTAPRGLGVAVTACVNTRAPVTVNACAGVGVRVAAASKPRSATALPWRHLALVALVIAVLAASLLQAIAPRRRKS